MQFRELLVRLLDAELDFVVVGGVAATLYGASEPTRDLDVCIRLSPESWARVAQILAPIHPRFALTPDKRPFQPEAAELATYRNLYVLTDLGRIDFVGEVPPVGDIERLTQTASTMTLDGRPFRVISLDDLLAVKDFVRRPKDLEVAAELRALRDVQRR